MTPCIYIDVFMWNLDTSVGRGGMNSSVSDISYIQLYYKLAANNVHTTPDRKAIYQSVKVTGACRGTDDDPLVRAIIAHQRGINHPYVDGRISVAHGGGQVGSGKAFFIYRIGARIATMFPAEWPRLDRITGCPAAVRMESLAAVPRIMPRV